jgi:hypothetical protein
MSRAQRLEHAGPYNMRLQFQIAIFKGHSQFCVSPLYAHLQSFKIETPSSQCLDHMSSDDAGQH